MDQLEITGLRIQTRLGVHAWEQCIRQEVLIDLQIPIDCSRISDELSRTIDYDALCKQLIAAVEAHSFRLIETLAEFVADTVKQQMPQISTLSIRVSKPHAVAAAKNISVYIQR